MLSSAIYSDGFLGHQHLLKRVEGLIQREQLPHALLFAGPEGVGKTIAARWVAASFLCERSGCGTCSVCRRVLSGSHPDFYVVAPEEGHRDIMIAQIRDLSLHVATKPFEASKKAAVIDQADRMNEEAQNAFLKTLEEPPPGSILILVSAAPDRLLPTIRSRCQRFRFSRLTDEELRLFAAQRPDLDPDFPERLCEGRPGRLLRLMEKNAGEAREIFKDFIASAARPSPVRASARLMAWAAGEGNKRQEVRENLRLALGIGAGLLRDLAMVMVGAERRQLLNQDFDKCLRDATSAYELSGLFYAVQQVFEATADIGGYVDPGLAVENVFRVIRDIRKRG